MGSERAKVRYSSTRKQRVECAECGELTPPAALEHDCFTVAYQHAREYAHRVNVVSTVTTTMAGYVDSE